MPKIFQSEHTYSYKNYSFGYTLYAQRIQKESLDPIYNTGFLPYSGGHRSGMDNLFYMARSARIELSSYSPTSENRRIKNKFKDYGLKSEEYSGSSFIDNEEMLNFCLEYFEKRHGSELMAKERLKRILGYSSETKVIEYKDRDGIPRAYIIEIHGKDFTHYWFSFYDLTLTYQSFGMWLMIDRVENAKNKGLRYCYLGTVYGNKALYKTNIPSLEYWNGDKWINDVKNLKERARTDDSRTVSQSDEFKE